MSKTVSFVVTDELAAYLEAEAERRMTTISSATQQLLAEVYVRGESTSMDATGGGDEVAADIETIENHPDKIDFLGVDAQHPWRVAVPDDFRWSRNYDYFTDRGGAAKALRRWYE